MGMQTRSTTSSPVKRAAPSVSAVKDNKQKSTPAKVLIAPQHLSTETRFVTLTHPRDNVPKRFVFCPEEGLFELTSVGVPRSDPRSILFTPANDSFKTTDSVSKSNSPHSGKIQDGYVSKESTMYTATPFNMAFVLLPVLGSADTSQTSTMFQPLDDLIDQAEIGNKHLQYIVRKGRKFVEDAMNHICESVDVGDEKMFRYSEDKVLDFVLTKAQRVADQGLPPSLEDKFVTRALEKPMLSVKSAESLQEPVPTSTPAPDAQDTDSNGERFESQASVASSMAPSIFSEASSTSTVATVVEEEDTVSTQVRQLQRLRVALNFITSTSLPVPVARRLQQNLSSNKSPVDFKPLNDYLKEVASLRAEALLSRSMNNYSRKRGSAEDEEAAESRAEKKRKLDEEEKKRKANESRGVRDLKKVNVTGMKKMSDFFAKAPVRKVKK